MRFLSILVLASGLLANMTVDGVELTRDE